MVIVQLIGGLGNQIFQYAMAKRLATLKETDLKFDLSFFKNYKNRKYDLSCFNIIEDIVRNEFKIKYNPDAKNREITNLIPESWHRM